MSTRAGPVDLPPWRPTAAHFRAVVLGAVGAVAAVVLRRPDVLVLATPFLVVATWAWLMRPSRLATVETAVGHTSVREGEASRWVSMVTLPEGAEDTVLTLAPSLFVEYDPPLGATAASIEEAVGGLVRAEVRFLHQGHRKPLR